MERLAATRGTPKLWKPVLNVTDLDAGERFRSAVTELSADGRHGDEGGEIYAGSEEAVRRPQEIGGVTVKPPLRLRASL